MDMVSIVKLIFIELALMIATETSHCAEQFQNSMGHLFLHRLWKLVTREEIYVVLELFMPMSVIQKPALQSYFSTKMVLSMQALVRLLRQSDGIGKCRFLYFDDSKKVHTADHESFEDLSCYFASK
jgi:hypothetical protein